MFLDFFFCHPLNRFWWHTKSKWRVCPQQLKWEIIEPVWRICGLCEGPAPRHLQYSSLLICSLRLQCHRNSVPECSERSFGRGAGKGRGSREIKKKKERTDKTEKDREEKEHRAWSVWKGREKWRTLSTMSTQLSAHILSLVYNLAFSLFLPFRFWCSFSSWLLCRRGCWANR